MRRERHSAEEIVNKVREVARGQSVAQACRQIGVAEQTYYRWRREYGGMKVNQAKRLKGLEKENARLKRVVTDQALDLPILKEVASGRPRGAAQHNF